MLGRHSQASGQERATVSGPCQSVRSVSRSSRPLPTLPQSAVPWGLTHFVLHFSTSPELGKTHRSYFDPAVRGSRWSQKSIGWEWEAFSCPHTLVLPSHLFRDLPFPTEAGAPCVIKNEIWPIRRSVNRDISTASCLGFSSWNITHAPSLFNI